MPSSVQGTYQNINQVWCLMHLRGNDTVCEFEHKWTDFNWVVQGVSSACLVKGNQTGKIVLEKNQVKFKLWALLIIINLFYSQNKLIEMWRGGKESSFQVSKCKFNWTDFRELSKWKTVRLGILFSPSDDPLETLGKYFT